ncbi:ATP synthase F0 subunit B' [Brevundimonas sp. AAP58]|uniref:F0F1 ATP synthase subunit B family protein n=1 Tax=Brevundimonas sp. AAP58 TaxID=1523422 RepID=UPI0006B8E112|nr:ATP synthase F0 subunit B' [Brevundimonas sp. AAP58]KPF83853.1 ATP synthase F0 subunit B' [Brevundimonas sp. AAP58]
MAAPEKTDEHGGTYATTEAAHGGGEAGGLPQFDTSVWAGQIVYLLFLFFVLYLLISKVFAPRLRRVMDERASTISNAIATARSVQAEAAEQAAAAKAEVEQARNDSRRLAAEAKARVAADAEARRQAEEAEVNAKIEAAEARIAATRDAAMAHVSTIAADTASAIVERLTGKPASATEVADAVKGAV